MYKKRNVFIAVGLMVFAALTMIVLFFLTGQSDSEDASSSGGTSREEYILANTIEKAPEAVNLVFLEEKKDCSFVYGSADLKKAAKDIAADYLDGVILKSSALSNKSTSSASDSETQKLSRICNYFVSAKKRAYVYCTAYLSADSIAGFRSFSHGVIIDLGTLGQEKAESINKKLKAARIGLGSRELFVICSDSQLISKLDKSLFDGVFLTVNSEADAENVKRVQSELFAEDISVNALTDFSVYGKDTEAQQALKGYYALRESTQMEYRAFSTYSDIKADTDNCYTAVKTYIETGIAPILAFRGIGVEDYDSTQVLKVEEPSHKVTLTASYLYPVYVNGKNIGLIPKGKGEIGLDLLRGKNSFVFSQNSKEVQYEVEYVFDGEIIRSVAPADRIKVSPGEELVVIVMAYNEAEVTVKVGTNEYPAEKQDGATGYTPFYARVKMPTDASEISSLGKISAVATMGGQTQQLDGASITPIMLEYTPGSTTTQKQLNNGTTFGIENYNPTYIDTEQQVKPSISAAISKATTNANNTPYTGNQTAVVSADYTDALPSGESLNFDPSFMPLAKGTKDFVIGESQFFDEEQNESYYYYELACGLKVARDSVTLEPSSPMPENNLTVNSVYGNGGELTIRLQNVWKVPYKMEFSEQSYYTNNNYPFYVSELNTSGISLTFYYTTAASGEIDCSASDVVSSATWSVSAENQTATLHLPLRERGVFYGCSIGYEGDEMVITVRKRLNKIAGSVVVLDPGHGADDCGAMGLSGAVKESDINILVAYQVKNFLEQQGVTVYMTRYGDDDISLEGRKIFARSVKADLYVSIHSDASENPGSMGSSAFYYKPFSMPLATNIHNEIISVYRNYLYAGQQDVYDEIDRGVKFYPFSVTRLDECPSVLIELGFMTNDTECYMLTVPQNQQLLGQAIAKGICETLIGK